jgi:hypothetical protein
VNMLQCPKCTTDTQVHIFSAEVLLLSPEAVIPSQTTLNVVARALNDTY